LIFLGVFFLDSLQIVEGPLFFNVAMAICSFLMCHEFFKAMTEKGFHPIKILGYACTLFLIPIGVVKTNTLMMICASIIPLIIFIGMSISVFSKLKYNVADVAITLFGAIYTILMVAFLSATRAMPMGVFLIFYIICGAWFSDIFAYLIGRFIGKHKFSTISPKKSIEGCIAGVFGTVIFFIVYSLCLNNMNFSEFKNTSETFSDVVPTQSIVIETDDNDGLVAKLDSDGKIQEAEISEDYMMQEKLKKNFYTNYPLLIILGILVSIVSQIGDFAASGIKRYCDIKDFSHLMPGHGGMLDRFDSILFVAPIIYYVFFIIVRL